MSRVSASTLQRLLSCHCQPEPTILCYRNLQPDDFATKVKQISSQSDLISVPSFVGPFVPYNQILSLHHFNLRSLYFQSFRSLPNLILLHTWELYQIAIHFNEQITRTHLLTSFCYSLLLDQSQLKLQVSIKGRQKFASNVILYPSERSRQNHLEDRA